MITIGRTIRWYNNYIDEVRDNVAEMCNDHVHMLKSMPPKYSVSQMSPCVIDEIF